MNKEEREIFKELFNVSLLAHTNYITGKLDVLNINITQINTHLETLNGRVGKHSEEIEDLKTNELIHVIECPNTEKIINIEKGEVGRKSVIKFIIIGSAIMGTIIGGIFTIVEFFIK